MRTQFKMRLHFEDGSIPSTRSAKQKGHSCECPFCFVDNPYGLRTHLQNIFVLDWGRIVCLVLPRRKLVRQGIFPYKFSIAPCLTKICLFALALLGDIFRIFDESRSLRQGVLKTKYEFWGSRIARKRLGRNSSTRSLLACFCVAKVRGTLA